MIDKYFNLSAVDFSKKIQTGELSAKKVQAIFMKRLKKINPTINAVNITYDALDECCNPTNTSILSGYPILIKDLIDVGGKLSTFGSFSCKNNIPEKSVDYIKAIEDAGMIIYGRTNVPEFASSVNTWNQLFGPTLNPWDISKSVNGSSGGAAAAVTSGISPLVHGTDGGGSNRLTSSVCGIFGFKPSRGRTVSGEPEGLDTSGKSFLKCNGPMSRHVIDSAALFDICEDKADESKFPAIGMITPPCQCTTPALTIGYLRNGIMGVNIDDDMKLIQDDVYFKLLDLGYTVKIIEANAITEDVLIDFSTYFLSRFTELVKNTIKPHKNLSPFINSEADYAAKFTAEEQSIAKNNIENIYPGLICNELFVRSECDVVFSAVHPSRASTISFLSPLDHFNEDRLDELRKTLGLTLMANIAGYTSMSVPLTFPSKDNDLTTPIGSLFNAKPGNEKVLFELAYHLEEQFPWKDQWPKNSIMNVK